MHAGRPITDVLIAARNAQPCVERINNQTYQTIRKWDIGPDRVESDQRGPDHRLIRELSVMG